MIALTRPPCPHPKSLAKGNYKHAANKLALRAAAYGKCMYCESHIRHSHHAHVEHIKPQAKYPQLKCAWENLGYCCEICNINKGEKYDRESPFINPFADDPEQHITFVGVYALEKNGSARGFLTIQEFGLNRTALIEARQDALNKIKPAIASINRSTISDLAKQRALAGLRQEAAGDKRYSAAVKCFLAAQNIFAEGEGKVF